MRLHLTGLWRNQDFVRLWAAQTVSIFGSLVTRTALAFTAILVLDATPFQIALLGIAEMAPAFVVGLVAGAWVDRLPRRPIMIAADLGRAAFLATIPLAAFLDILRMHQLYLVGALVSVLTTFFDIAYQSYLPTLIRREQLVEGNSKLTASASVSEFAAFGSGGWLVQIFSAPGAVLVDSVSFLWSAWFILRIRGVEAPPSALEERQALRREIADGMRRVLRDPILRALAGTSMTVSLAYRVIGAVYLLYVSEELGFGPGALGMIFAIGGGSALAGAVAAGRINAALGVGPVMIVMLIISGAGTGLIALATGVTVVAVIYMVAQQLIGDSSATIYEINLVSLRQTVTPEQSLGRVIGSMRVLDFGAMLVGGLLGGWLGETVGLRPTLVVGAALIALASIWLLLSPIRGLRLPSSPSAGISAEPLSELG